MTLQEKIQKGLDCWCDRVHAETLDECKGLGCPYAGDDDCSTLILKDMDELLKEGGKPTQPIAPNAVMEKALNDIRSECSTMWDGSMEKDELLREIAYIAGIADMTLDVCRMLGGDGDGD